MTLFKKAFLLNSDLCRHDGEARLNEHISELKKELALRDKTIAKLEKTIADKQEVGYLRACF